METPFRMQAEFIYANAALEGRKLSLSDMKNVFKILRGKATADEIIQKIILERGYKKKETT